MEKLQNKVALVTGASRGISAAIAKRFAREGASVALTYQTSKDKAEQVAQEIRQLGGKAIALRADGADPQAVISAVDKTVQEFGGLHILVNNAGIAFYHDISQLTLEDFDHMMAVNVR